MFIAVTRSVFPQATRFIKMKEEFITACHRPDKVKEAWQLHAMWILMISRRKTKETNIKTQIAKIERNAIKAWVSV